MQTTCMTYAQMVGSPLCSIGEEGEEGRETRKGEGVRGREGM